MSLFTDFPSESFTLESPDNSLIADTAAVNAVLFEGVPIAFVEPFAPSMALTMSSAGIVLKSMTLPPGGGGGDGGGEVIKS